MKTRSYFPALLMFLGLFAAGLFFAPLTAFSGGIELPPCPVCFGSSCWSGDCNDAKDELEEDHRKGRRDIIDFIGQSHGGDGVGGTGQFRKFEDWQIWFARQHMIRAMMMMTEQLSAIAMQQAMAVGMFFDAEQQMDMQRSFQKLQTDIHRDYHPSEDFCWFGTNARSLAHSEQRGFLNTQALNVRQRARHLGVAINPAVGTPGAYNEEGDRIARWEQFTSTYCDPMDNDHKGAATGLEAACNGGGARVNNDIDYTRMVEFPRTIDMNLRDGSDDPADVDIMAMSSNIYGHDLITRGVDSHYLKNPETEHLYLALRSVIAKRAVAEHSFNSIVGMKTSGSTEAGDQGSQTRNFLYAIMQELGVPADDIEGMIGENPSYYAQLELLAKKIYQNQDFYADLYDKPANVKRTSAALRAIEVMLDRAMYESQVRREMLTSVLLSAKLHKPFKQANDALGGD